MDTLIMNNYYLLQKKENNRDMNFYNELFHFFQKRYQAAQWIVSKNIKNLFYKIESLMIIFILRSLYHVYKKKS